MSPRNYMLIGAGAATLAIAWLGPLPRLAGQAFTAHMAMHVGVVAVAAPLLAVGAAGTRWDPVRKRPGFFAPIPASIIELVIIWGWHAPALHHFARSTKAGLVLEQGMFLAAGLLLWLSAFGGGPQKRRERAGPGVVALLMTSTHMSLLGVLLALSPRLLYDHRDAAVYGITAGMTLLEDQQAGGVLMLLGGGVSYLVGGLVLLAGMLRSKPGDLA